MDGYIGRIMTWRQRLDVTTNWAIVSCSGIVSFALHSPEPSHFLFLIANFLCLFLLVIEARRYRYYDAFRARVRMLEAHFIMPVVMKNTSLLQGNWDRVLSEDLASPSFKISRMDAIVRRFRRNYIWIFGIILMAWMMHLSIPQTGGHDWHRLAQMFANHLITATLMVALVALLYGFLAYLLVRCFLLENDSAEFSGGMAERSKWM